MAVDITSANNSPYIKNIASQGTTWNKVSLPPWAKYITAQGVAAIYVAFHDATDAGAVGATPKASIAAASYHTVRLPVNVRPVGASSKDIYVAAQAGTTDITLIVEG